MHPAVRERPKRVRVPAALHGHEQPVVGQAGELARTDLRPEPLLPGANHAMDQGLIGHDQRVAVLHVPRLQVAGPEGMDGLAPCADHSRGSP